jgi:type IV pilus assembly protein PilB
MESMVVRQTRLGDLLVQREFISEQQVKEALHHQETRTPYKPLDELCVDLGFISTVVLRVALDRYRIEKLLGNVLLRMGVVSMDQLGEALSVQKRARKRLGQILLDKRYITKVDLAEALSIQLGISKIAPNVYMVDPMLLAKATPEYFRRHRVVPLFSVVMSGDRNKEIVTVLMEDPLDITTIGDLGRVFNAEIQRAVSATLDLEDFLNEIFEHRDRYRGANPASDPDISAFHQTEEVSFARNDVPASQMKLEEHNCSITSLKAQEDGAKVGGVVIDEGDCSSVEAGKTAVAILNSIVFSAVKERARDIHIEPLENRVCIRYRIDGVLRHEADLPKAIAAALTTRVKTLSGLVVAETRRRQDGCIEVRIAGRDLDLRVSTYVSLWGENVVIRIVNRKTVRVDINKLALSQIEWVE